MLLILLGLIDGGEVSLSGSNLPDTVVWNPWNEKVRSHCFLSIILVILLISTIILVIRTSKVEQIQKGGGVGGVPLF